MQLFDSNGAIVVGDGVAFNAYGIEDSGEVVYEAFQVVGLWFSSLGGIGSLVGAVVAGSA